MSEVNGYLLSILLYLHFSPGDRSQRFSIQQILFYLSITLCPDWLVRHCKETIQRHRGGWGWNYFIVSVLEVFNRISLHCLKNKRGNHLPSRRQSFAISLNPSAEQSITVMHHDLTLSTSTAKLFNEYVFSCDSHYSVAKVQYSWGNVRWNICRMQTSLLSM